MRKIVLAVGLTLLTVLTLVRGADPFPVQALREFYFDSLQRLHPREFTELPIRVVDADEDSLAALGQWPWPRDMHAQLVQRLTDYGAAVIVYDVLFSESDRMSPSELITRLAGLDLNVPAIGLDQLAAMNTDAMFAEAIASSNVVLGTAQIARQTGHLETAKAGFVEIGEAPAIGLPWLTASSPIVPVLREAAAGIGSISVSPRGETSLVRQAPLIWQSDAGLMPSLALEALRLAFGESTILIKGIPDARGIIEKVQMGGLEIPTLPDGQIWIRYRRDEPSLYVPVYRVMAEGDDPEVRAKLQGHIVLIGTSAAGLLDIRTTALRESVPGVSIHAQIMEQILLGDHLRRDDVISALEILTFVSLGLVVLIVMSLAGPIWSITAGTSVGILVLAGSWFAFTDYGILFDASYSIVGGFAAFSVPAAYQFIVADRDKRMIRTSFSHYVAPSILEQIERSNQFLALGGVNRTVTVMFCDIRNFTPLSETMSATELVGLLNELFTALGEKILKQEGTIDKFIGDAIMAFWNAPLETEHHRVRAAQAALGMRVALAGFNDNMERSNVRTAIGISSGLACVGNIGSKDRFNYSAIGDTVNVAARIETACRHVDYDILLTEDTAEGVDDLALLDSGRLELKGKSELTQSYILVGDNELKTSDDFRALKDCHDHFVKILGSGGGVDQDLLQKCRDLGQKLEPGLATFYARIEERPGDYAHLAVA